MPKSLNREGAWISQNIGIVRPGYQIKAGEPIIWIDSKTQTIHISEKIEPFPGIQKKIKKILRRRYPQFKKLHW